MTVNLIADILSTERKTVKGKQIFLELLVKLKVDLEAVHTKSERRHAFRDF